MRHIFRGRGLLDHIINFMAFLAAFMLIFVMLLVCAEVVMRYFLRKPIAWELEVTEYLLIFITFLVAAWVLKREGHVKVDIFVNLVKPRIQVLFGIVTSAIGVIVCLVFTWYGAVVTIDHYRENIIIPRSLLGAPYAPILAIIPIGMFFLMLQFIRRTLGYLNQRKR